MFISRCSPPGPAPWALRLCLPTPIFGKQRAHPLLASQSTCLPVHVHKPTRCLALRRFTLLNICFLDGCLRFSFVWLARRPIARKQPAERRRESSRRKAACEQLASSEERRQVSSRNVACEDTASSDKRQWRDLIKPEARPSRIGCVLKLPKCLYFMLLFKVWTLLMNSSSWLVIALIDRLQSSVKLVLSITYQKHKMK